MRHIPLPDAPPPHEAHARLAAKYDTTFILESREGPERMAQYSFVGFDPAGTITATPAGLSVTGSLPHPSDDQDPFEYLRRVQAFYDVQDHGRPFVGGLVGSIGYDAVRILEPVLANGGAEIWPRFIFGLYLDGIVYDHADGTATYVTRGEDRSVRLLELLGSPAPAAELEIGPIQSHVPQHTFEAQVEEAKLLIRTGEAFQIVLSRPFVTWFKGSLTRLYDWLREKSAVPYLYHLRFGGEVPRQLLGASPEMLVRVRKGIVETFPIAGTRAVTGDDAADDAAAAALIADTKETAEHAMLVDLARNDLGRVCEAGTIDVVSYQKVQRFHRVQHLVSHVRGRLHKHHDAWDALAAVFPAGTVSGAPKIRAMEHIDAIESRPRGAYAGSVAYVSFNGDFDSAIAIRSLSAVGDTVTVQAGAGIVHRSNPRDEFEETAHKASALLEALNEFQEAQ